MICTVKQLLPLVAKPSEGKVKMHLAARYPRFNTPSPLEKIMSCPCATGCEMAKAHEVQDSVKELLHVVFSFLKFPPGWYRGAGLEGPHNRRL